MDDVSVWVLPVAPVQPDVLDQAERAAAARLRRATDRARYVAAHVVRRELLGPLLDLAPAELRFGCHPCPLCGGPHGRPFVAQDPTLHVSLSHTSGRIALAASRRVVGIDVERLGGVDLSLLRGALHPREGADDEAAALRTWVRKEAYLKALGTGLGLEPSTVDVSTDPPGWRVHDLDAGAAHVAALAVEDGPA